VALAVFSTLLPIQVAINQHPAVQVIFAVCAEHRHPVGEAALVEQDSQRLQEHRVDQGQEDHLIMELLEVVLAVNLLVVVELVGIMTLVVKAPTTVLRLGLLAVLEGVMAEGSAAAAAV
jgi:hypothetical protein